MPASPLCSTRRPSASRYPSSLLLLHAALLVLCFSFVLACSKQQEESIVTAKPLRIVHSPEQSRFFSVLQSRLTSERALAEKDASRFQALRFIPNLELVPLSAHDAFEYITRAEERNDVWLAPGLNLVELTNASLVNLGAPHPHCERIFQTELVFVANTRAQTQFALDTDGKKILLQRFFEDTRKAAVDLLHAHPLHSSDGLFSALALWMAARERAGGDALLTEAQFRTFQTSALAYGADSASLLDLVVNDTSGLPRFVLLPGSSLMNYLREHPEAKSQVNAYAIGDLNWKPDFALCSSGGDWVSTKTQGDRERFLAWMKSTLDEATLAGFGYEPYPVSSDQAVAGSQATAGDIRRIWEAWAKSLVSPVSLTLVLDTSGSMMGEPLRVVQAALRSFLLPLQERDHVAVIGFSARPELRQPLSKYSQKTTHSLDSLVAGGGSSIYDAVQVALEQHKQELLASQEKRRRIILLVTDGSDLNSQRSLTSVIENMKLFSHDARILLLAVGIQNGNTDLSDIARLAQESGGLFRETTLSNIPVTLGLLAASL